MLSEINDLVRTVELSLKVIIELPIFDGQETMKNKSLITGLFLVACFVMQTTGELSAAVSEEQRLGNRIGEIAQEIQLKQSLIRDLLVRIKAIKESLFTSKSNRYPLEAQERV